MQTGDAPCLNASLRQFQKLKQQFITQKKEENKSVLRHLSYWVIFQLMTTPSKMNWDLITMKTTTTEKLGYQKFELSGKNRNDHQTWVALYLLITGERMNISDAWLVTVGPLCRWCHAYATWWHFSQVSLLFFPLQLRVLSRRLDLHMPPKFLLSKSPLFSGCEANLPTHHYSWKVGFISPP